MEDNKCVMEQFLKEISLENYLSNFIENKIDYNQLQTISEQDLISIGIQALGDRKKIISQIEIIASKQDNTDLLAQFEYNNKLIKSLMKSSFAILLLIGVSFFLIELYSHWKEPNPEDFSELYTIGMQAILIPIGLWILSFIYLYPSYLAFKKVHQYRWAILLTNLFFGATVVIWFICLFVSLALIGDKETAMLAYLGSKKL